MISHHGFLLHPQPPSQEQEQEHQHQQQHQQLPQLIQMQTPQLHQFQAQPRRHLLPQQSLGGRKRPQTLDVDEEDEEERFRHPNLPTPKRLKVERTPPEQVNLMSQQWQQIHRPPFPSTLAVSSDNEAPPARKLEEQPFRIEEEEEVDWEDADDFEEAKAKGKAREEAKEEEEEEEEGEPRGLRWNISLKGLRELGATSTALQILRNSSLEYLSPPSSPSPPPNENNQLVLYRPALETVFGHQSIKRRGRRSSQSDDEEQEARRIQAEEGLADMEL